jgi:hypothetical protein
MQRGLTLLKLVFALATMASFFAVALQARRFLWSSQAQAAHSATLDLAEGVAQFRREHGRLPGDLNGDGEIDTSGETAVSIGGRRVTLRAIGRHASPIRGFAPHVRNVIELRGLPCNVAEELDARTDDGSFSAGNTRASVARCAMRGLNDPVPVLAVVFR